MKREDWLKLSKHDRRLRIQAMIWEEWQQGRKNPGFGSMSMTERDELLDKYRDKLRTKVQATGKPILPKVDKAELRRIVEAANIPVTKVRTGSTVERMVAAFEESFLEKE